jgi:hypothetical protein
VCQQTCQNHRRRGHTQCGKTVWRSGPRRWLQAPFRKGMGSSPTAVICCVVGDVESRNLEWLCHCATSSRSCSLFRPRQLPMVCSSIKAPLSLHRRSESGWYSGVTCKGSIPPPRRSIQRYVLHSDGGKTKNQSSVHSTEHDICVETEPAKLQSSKSRSSPPSVRTT